MTLFTERDLLILSERAYKTNLETNICGFLYHNNGYFLQYIEGEETVINSLYERISVDPSHKVLFYCKFQEFNSRLFPNWSMRCFSPQEIAQNEQLLMNIAKFLKQSDATEKKKKACLIRLLKRVKANLS